MEATDTGQLLVAAIPLLIGVYATLLGLGILGKKPSDPVQAARVRRQNRVLCILGPGAIVFGLYTAFSRRPPPPPPEVTWQRCATEDGVCSVELPGRPEEYVQTVGRATYRGWALTDEQQNTFYLLTSAELSEEARPETVEKKLDSARDVLVLLGKESNSALQLIDEQKISQDDVSGRELEYSTSREQVVWIRFFLRGKQLYRLLAAAPRDKHQAEIRRFLDSVRFTTEGKAK